MGQAVPYETVLRDGEDATIFDNKKLKYDGGREGGAAGGVG